MDKIKKLKLLEDVLELEEGTLNEDLILKSVSFWDSMAKLTLIVMFDETFNKKINNTDIYNLIKVKDILELMS